MQGLLINTEPKNQEFAVTIGCTTSVQIPLSFFEIHAHVMLKLTVTQKQAELCRPHTMRWGSLARQNYSPVLPAFEGELPPVFVLAES